MSKARGDLSTSKVVKSQLDSEIRELYVRCKDYENKIMDARQSAKLVARSHINKYLKSESLK